MEIKSLNKSCIWETGYFLYGYDYYNFLSQCTLTSIFWTSYLYSVNTSKLSGVAVLLGMKEIFYYCYNSPFLWPNFSVSRMLFVFSGGKMVP